MARLGFISSFAASSLLFASLLAACGSDRAAHKTNSEVKHAEWSLVWFDEFDGAALDRSKWEPETSCWGGGNNERQCYVDQPDNIVIKDGVLRLKAKAQAFLGPEFAQDMPDRGRVIRREYTSGKIRTKGLASWQYGRFEARIKLPKGQGIWPAFWMLPEHNAYGKWPLSGEIDIMEAVNLGAQCDDCEGSDTENRSSAALHYGKKWPNNEFKSGKNILPDGIDAYHIFALEWTEGRFDWFVNDKKIFTMKKDEWYSEAVDRTGNALAPFDQPFHLILNLAVGGEHSESQNEKTFDESAFPNALLVDWVRVYACAGDLNSGKKCIVPE